MAIETSAAYKAAIKADSEMTRFEAEFGFIPAGSREGSVVTSTDQHELSRIAQMRDGLGEMLLYATLEPGGWPLDGTRVIIDPEDSSQQIGYMSNSICGADGVFTVPPPITYTMDAAYDIIGVTLFFGELEWATSVTIKYYNASNALINTGTFANDRRIMAVEFPQAGVKKIVVSINAWNLPLHCAKACEIIPGEVFIFDPDNTFSFEFTESIKPFETALEFPQFIIKFDNTDKKFDVVNPSGLMAYLRQLMQIFSKIGILTSAYDYVSTGNFFVYSWPDTSQDDSAQLVCKPKIAFKNNLYYVAPGTGTQTVAQAAAVIFGLASMTNYTVHASLQSITVNQFIGKDVPLVNAMGQLAVAAGGYWKFNRDGSYSLLPFAIPSASNSVDFDNMWTKPSIVQEKKITSVNVKYYVWNGVDSLTETNNVVTATINDGAAASDICSCFVPTAARANAIGALALSYHAMRLSHSVSYRGDMSIEAGDVITVENDYGDCDVLIKKSTITWDVENKLNGSFAGVANV